MKKQVSNGELTPYQTPGKALAAQATERPDAEAMVFPKTNLRMTFGESAFATTETAAASRLSKEVAVTFFIMDSGNLVFHRLQFLHDPDFPLGELRFHTGFHFG